MRIGKEYNNHCILVGKPLIGERTWVGYFCLIDGSGGLEIGKDCCISSGVHIYSHDSVTRCVTNGRKRGEGPCKSPARIGNNIFIGANAVILRGVTIEDKAIVGAGSVVLENTHIKSGEVRAGVPAKRVK